MIRTLLLALALAFRIPLMMLCAAGLVASVFMISKGFKDSPGDLAFGLQGIGLMLASIVLFPSRQHILYRLWVARRPARAPAAAARRAAPRPVSVARPAAVLADPVGPSRALSAALYDGRVRLDFILPPPPPTKATSWIGGLPKLPPQTEWPHGQNSPCLFVAQVALADLPRKIWAGLAPRSGSLAIFVDPDSDFANVTVLHVDGLLQDRAYPSPLMVGQAYPILRRGASGELLAIPPDDSGPPLMKWPVRVTPVAADQDLPSPHDKTRAPDNAAARLHQRLSLQDPAFVPYSWTTLLALLTTLLIDLNGSVRTEQRSGKTSALYLQSHADRTAAAKTVMALRDDLRRRSRSQAFSAEIWDEVVANLSGSLVRSIRTIRNPDTATAEITLLPPEPVLKRLPLHKYFSAFEYLSRQVYTADPDRLPPQVRAALAPLWQQDAAHEVASMGGQINLAAYVTAGRSDLVCLIELPRSELIGTSWHDLSSLGVFISPEDLADWRLDRAIGLLSER